jgi:uncharacterized protein
LRVAAPDNSTLNNLRKDAKRWLKALRAGDPDDRPRFARADPGGPAVPTLRDVRHALAREHGALALIDWEAAAILRKVLESNHSHDA